MSRTLKYTFLTHTVVSLLLGVALLIAPGRFLEWMGWAPIDPIISRLLGAALVALAWSSFRGWQATDRAQVAILLQTEVVFTVLGCVGLLRHLLVARFPLVPWIALIILAAFAVAWITSLVRE